MKIFTNTAISLDGRIASGEGNHFFLGSKEDARMMSVLRSQADAILVGGASFRNWPHPLVPDQKYLLDDDKPWRWNIVVSRRMDFQFSNNYLRQERHRSLFFTSKSELPEKFPFEVIQSLQDPKPADIVAELTKRGVKNLLLEAGGDLIYQFLVANLIDEMNVTLCPRLIGGKGSASLVDGMGFTNETMKALRLVSQRVVGDELYLRYSIKPYDATLHPPLIPLPFREGNS